MLNSIERQKQELKQGQEDEFGLGLALGYCRRLKFTQNNTPIIVEYLRALENEIHLSDNYKRINLTTLVYLSRFHLNKIFKDMTKDDIILYLNSLRKNETTDPMHGWVSTYNLYLIVLTRFFKWLHYPDLSPKERLKPSCVDIPRLKRKEQSIYKPSDMWTQEDDILFLKYCPSKRDRCYHAISRDTSCRPHELLKLKIKDVVFKMSPASRQYAEVLVNGKTGQRHIPLINSIPFLKDWILNHPQSGNPNSVLICGLNKSLGRSIRIESLNHIYQTYKKEFFPKLLNNPNVSSEDKEKIIELLKKPWNPYIRRHSALTEKSKILKEHVLRQHAGWTTNSNMHQKYVHYYGNESSESILEAYGLKPKLDEIDKLKPKMCPNCSEQNRSDSKFCSKCRMVLSYDAYTEVVQAKIEKTDYEKLDAKIDALARMFFKNNVRLGNDGMDFEDMEELSEEEIERHIARSRLIRKIRREKENKLIHQIQKERI